MQCDNENYDIGVDILDDAVDEWNIFDSFDIWSKEFDQVPPSPEYNMSANESTDGESFSDNSSPRSIFVDETITTRWAAPSNPNTIVGQLHISNNISSIENSCQNLAIVSTTQPLTARLLRRQQQEWFTKTENEKKGNQSNQSNSKRKLDGKQRAPSSKLASTAVMISPCINLPTLSSTSSASTTSLEIKLVEVLSYSSNILRAVNIGNPTQLHETLNRVLAPTCVMRKLKGPGGPPIKIVPRDKMVDFFLALLEAVPDAVWKIEDTKLLKGKPRSVASTFIKSGTMLNNSAKEFIESFSVDGEIDPICEMVSSSETKRRTMRGTFILQLNDALRVTSFDVIVDLPDELKLPPVIGAPGVAANNGTSISTNISSNTSDGSNTAGAAHHVGIDVDDYRDAVAASKLS